MVRENFRVVNEGRFVACLAFLAGLFGIASLISTVLFLCAGGMPRDRTAAAESTACGAESGAGCGAVCGSLWWCLRCLNFLHILAPTKI